MYTGANIIRNGLVLALDAASKNSYPGTGTTWTDLSGNNNNGTLINSPTFSSTNEGIFIFNGTTQNISLPSSLTRLNTNYSIGVWFLPTRVASSYLTSDWSFSGRNYNVTTETNNKITLSGLIYLKSFAISLFTNSKNRSSAAVKGSKTLESISI